MAAGCAVVASNLRCFDDYLVHGETGLRFNHGGAEAVAALAGQLERLLTEPALTSGLGAAGRRAALDFSVSAIAGRMLDDFGALRPTGLHQ